jgi:hypothetical protein
MDFMFEDEVDEVGSDVEAYCPKCKADTTHVVISKYEDEIRRVQCNPCGDVHSFRKPRGETEDDVPEPVAAKKRALLRKATWEEFFAKKKADDAKPYEFREHYRENAIVSHPKFGVGFVSEIVSDSKAEITFQDARRILVHNRKDIPGIPLAAEGDGTPTPAPKAVKAPKEKDAAKPPAAPKAAAPAAKAPAPPKAAPPTKEPAAKAAAPTAKAAAPSAKAAAPAAKTPAKAAEPKVQAAPKPAVAKPTKAAPPRGGKPAAKAAAKKPAAKPSASAAKKSGGKKR